MTLLTFPRTHDGVYSVAQFEFLRECRQVLSEEDYLDVLDAIEDASVFHTLDEDLKVIVSAYHEVR